MTRTGNRKELLLGPLLYGLTFILTTCYFWIDSFTGIIASIILSVGDGFSGLIGERYSKVSKYQLPHNRLKTWQGTISFFISSVIFCLFFVHFFEFQVSLMFYTKIILTSFVSALVESLPLKEWDNIIVYIFALLFYKLLDVLY